MKSNECNSFNLHEFNHTSNQTKQKDCKLYKLDDTSMETFFKNPITGFLKLEGFVDLWVDANVVMVGECTPICPVGFYSFPNCKGIIHDLIIISNFTIEEIWSLYNYISKYTIISL